MSDATRLRLPAKLRLKRVGEFERVRKCGKTVRGGLLTLGALRLEEEQSFRVGFVTSRRIGGAVVRNRVRRRLREIVRRRQREIVAGSWFVVIARPAAARVDSATLEGEWERLAGRAGILSERATKGV